MGLGLGLGLGLGVGVGVGLRLRLGLGVGVGVGSSLGCPGAASAAGRAMNAATKRTKILDCILILKVEV